MAQSLTIIDPDPQDIVARVCVRGEFGLHARPAARMAQLAQNFTASITLEANGNSVDAKSILDLLSLAATQGTELTLRCQGPDAQAAVEAITEFFK